MRRAGARPWLASLLIESPCSCWRQPCSAWRSSATTLSPAATGRPPWWVLAVAALAVALLLRAARPAVARRIRRLLLGEQAASSYETVTDFISRMTTTLDVDEVLPRLAEAAARSVHSERGEVSVRLDDGRSWRQVWPEAADAQVGWESPGALTVPVQHGGRVVGEIGVIGDDDEMSAGDRHLLGELAAPAGVALATVRLTFELRERARQLAALASDLQACQARMVVARSDERRRLLARVETAVVPRLDETDSALRSLAETANSAEAARSLEDARTAAMASLEAVRGVARGIFPNLLADAGIGAALRRGARSGCRRSASYSRAICRDCGRRRRSRRPSTSPAWRLAARRDAKRRPRRRRPPVTVELEVADAAGAGAGSMVEMWVPTRRTRPCNPPPCWRYRTASVRSGGR